MLTFTTLLVLFLCSMHCECSSVYLFQGNPFESEYGPLTPHQFHIDRSEYTTFVVHPKQPGNYSVLLFIGGFAGVVPSELYSNYFHRLASMGIIVIGFDIVLPWKKPERFFKEYEFLKEHFQGYLDREAKGVRGLLEDYAGIFCHSGGCELSTKLILEDHDFVKVQILVDPVGYLLPPMPISVPTFVTGGGIEGFCAPRNISYHKFYEMYQCPKILYNQTDYAHCGPANPSLVKPCSLLCGGGKANREDFHRWIAGVTTSMVSVVLKNGVDCTNQKEYLLNAKLFPISVSDFKTDFSCISPGSSCLA